MNSITTVDFTDFFTYENAVIYIRSLDSCETNEDCPVNTECNKIGQCDVEFNCVENDRTKCAIGENYLKENQLKQIKGIV